MSVSYLVNEHDGKDCLVYLTRRPVMDTTDVHFKHLGIRMTQNENGEGEVTNWYLREREHFFNQQIHLGPFICTYNNSGGLQNGKGDAVK